MRESWEAASQEACFSGRKTMGGGEGKRNHKQASNQAILFFDVYRQLYRKGV